MRCWIWLAAALAVTGCGSSESAKSGNATGRQQFLAFSVCMRSHGVPDFPDPSSRGGIDLVLGSGLDPASPSFQSAQRSCKHLLPHGGPPAHETEGQKLPDLAFARCMRAHGVPDYPDPTTSIGNRFFRGTPLPAGIDPGSPAFRKASAACGQP
jgi:hypothetical protein